MQNKIDTVEEYIDSFPKEVAEILYNIRKIVIENAPNAVECISYAMPAYKLNKKILLYFAAFSKHIGLYATPAGHEKFAKALSKYKQGKGSVQFPFNDVPYDLIAEIVRFRVEENNYLTAKSKRR